MFLTQLRAFRRVARAGSFTQAAKEAAVSQPTLSAQVKALESAYRLRLFERQKRGVQLTPVGRTLLQIVDRLFAAEEEAHAVMAGAESGVRGELRIAADSAHHVMPILTALKERHPLLSFSLKVDNSDSVLAHVIEGRVDVGVMARQVADPRLHAFRLKRDRLVLFVPADHSWAGRKSIKLTALDGEALVMRERGSITREVLERRLAEAGVKAGTLIDVETREGVREAVAAGFGIGVIFVTELGQDSRFRAIELSGTDVTVAEYVVCREEVRRLPLVHDFLELAAGRRN